MDLEQIRKEIDDVDDRLLELFQKRMSLSDKVAEYKLENNMPVFQGAREQQILDRLSGRAENGLENSVRMLFTEIMDVSKCRQNDRLTPYLEQTFSPTVKNPVAACPGIRGSYCEEACLKAFGGELKEIRFYDTFDRVFEAIENGEADYGVVALENSTAGDVSATYDLMGKYNLYIAKRVRIPINHVLAAKKSVPLGLIKTVISHEQALHQCSRFIAENNLVRKHSANTSIAAKTVGENDDDAVACICSAACAKLYGLEIIAEGIADNNENYTRFICISKNMEISEGANVISVSLSLAHTPGSLFRLLTRFAYCGLNLTKIESKPLPPDIAGKIREEEFDVVFYFDFDGSVKDEKVAKMLVNIEKDSRYYKFLGNYGDIL